MTKTKLPSEDDSTGEEVQHRRPCGVDAEDSRLKVPKYRAVSRLGGGQAKDATR